MAIQSVSSSQSLAAAAYASQQAAQLNEQRDKERQQVVESKRQTDTVTLSQDAQGLQQDSTRKPAEARPDEDSLQVTERQARIDAESRREEAARAEDSRAVSVALSAYRETARI